MKKLPIYITPEDFTCPACNSPSTIIVLDNSFNYSGTHCTHGQSGIHYPSGYGSPVTSCCEAEIANAEIDEPDYYEPFN